MAATNFTPIILYHTTTASAAPTAGNLNNGELAINITDGKLFYKDNGGTVQVIATKGTGTIGGSNTQVQYNSSGALAGSANFTFNGTTATINTLNLTNALGTTFGGTGLNAYTTGDLVYASGTNTLAKLGIGLNTYILTSTGSVPQWSAPSAVTVATATNLAGGAAGSVPYQSGASTTTFLSIGTQNQVLTSTGSAPQWSSGLTLTTLVTTGNTTLGDAAADNLTVNATITSNLIFTDNTYDIGASLANRPRNLYLSSAVNAGAGQFTLLTASNSMYFTAATSSDIAGTIYTVPTIQNWSVGAVGNDFQFYPSNIFTGTPTLTLKTNKQVIVGESSTTAAGGASIRLVVTGASSGGIQMYGNASGGSAIVPVAGGGMQFYSYTGAQGSESYVLRGLYNGSGNWALGSSGPSIVSNIGVATYGGIYSDRGATGGATQTLLTLSASSGSDFGQISNAGATWSLGYGSAVNTTDPVLTWTAGKRVGINTAVPNSTLEVSASFADSAIEEIARFARVGGSSLYGNNRAAAITFWDQNNATLTAAVAGIRLTPSGNYNGDIALYYNNTGAANATSVSQLTQAVRFGSYGALFAGASGVLTGTGIAVYSAGYTNLTLQSAGSAYGSLVDFTEGSGNTLLYRMGVNHNSIGTGNFAFSYGTGPTGPAWSVLSNGTFGAGNINVADISGGGNVRFVSNTGVNAGPATSGTTQTAALRLRGGDNAVLDMGMNSVNTWIQATDKSALQSKYYLHLNPNGGTVTINAGTSSPSLTNGLYLQADSSTTEVFRIQGASSSGLYQTFYNGTVYPLYLGYGATLSASATNNDGVIRYNGSYYLIVTKDGSLVSYWNTSGRLNNDIGSYSNPSISTASFSGGLQINTSASYNDSSAHQFNSVNDKMGVIHISSGGLSSIPFYCNNGGGIAYQWTVLNPQTGTWTTGQGPTVNFTDAGSSPNSYSVVFNGGGGSFTITRTGGSKAYAVAVQLFAAT